MKKGFADVVLMFVLCVGIAVIFGDKNTTGESAMKHFDRTGSSSQVNEVR